MKSLMSTQGFGQMHNRHQLNEAAREMNKTKISNPWLFQALLTMFPEGRKSGVSQSPKDWGAISGIKKLETPPKGVKVLDKFAFASSYGSDEKNTMLFLVEIAGLILAVVKKEFEGKVGAGIIFNGMLDNEKQTSRVKKDFVQYKAQARI